MTRGPRTAFALVTTALLAAAPPETVSTAGGSPSRTTAAGRGANVCVHSAL